MNLNFDDLLDGKMDEKEARQALIELYNKGESVEDVKNAMLAMRKRMIPVELDNEILENAIDNCGTGGDGLHTFNISSIASIILASLGVFVAKHGNRSITSKSGSADMLEELGIKLNLTPKQNAKLLQESGFCFLFAQNHHPCMKFVMPIRKSIPHRTIFNILGPLCNPAGIKKHLIGVYDFDKASIMATALNETGSVSGITLSTINGADEALPFEETKIANFANSMLQFYSILPYLHGSVKDLAGGDAKENAQITVKMLKNEIDGIAKETVILNVALGLIAANKTQNLEEAKNIAKEAIESKKALQKLEKIIEISNKI